ncbi:MAG: efflux RND transporter periplasmic adaptor subunit [Clostridia bacterium]|nr:efflux RND transporter periplasmic adaptor subunit [Clostridia bacterium]
MKLSKNKKTTEADVQTEDMLTEGSTETTQNQSDHMDVKEETDTDIQIVDLNAGKKKPDAKKKKLIRRIVIGSIIVIIFAVIIVMNLSAKNALPMISTVEIQKGDLEETIVGTGFVNTEISKTYFSPVNATLDEFPYKVGDRVKSGDKLVSFITDDLAVATQKEELSAIASDQDYKHSLNESAKAANEYAIAKANVDTYRLLIAAQRNYINDLTASISGIKNTLADTAQCARDGIQNKINSKNDEITNKTKEMNTIILDESGNPVGGNSDRYLQLKNEIADLSNEVGKLNASINSVYYPANTIPQDRQLADAQNLLSDMQSYLAKDESRMETAKNAMLDSYSREKIKATNESVQLTAEQAQKDLQLASEGIYAEFDGIITNLPAVSGGPATKGTELLTVQSVSDTMVTVPISKYDLAKIAIGQKAELTIAGNKYEGVVSRINGIAVKNDSGNPIIDAEIHIENPDDKIYLGVEGKAIIHTNSVKDAVLVPVETINVDMAGSFCYIIENNTLVRRNVKTGISSDVYIEVIEGLNAGDHVVNDTMATLTEGMAATEMPSTPATPDDAATDTISADTASDNEVSTDSAKTE